MISVTGTKPLTSNGNNRIPKLDRGALQINKAFWEQGKSKPVELILLLTKSYTGVVANARFFVFDYLWLLEKGGCTNK